MQGGVTWVINITVKWTDRHYVRSDVYILKLCSESLHGGISHQQRRKPGLCQKRDVYTPLSLLDVN